MTTQATNTGQAVIMSRDQFDELINELHEVRETVAQLAKPEREAETTPDDFLTIEEVCQVFNATRGTIWRWSKTGLLTSTKWGSKVRYSRQAVEALLHNTQNPNR